MIDKNKILSLAEQALEGSDIYIVKLDIRPGNNIYIYLDSEQFVKIEDCIRVSRFIESNLNRDVEDFSIEVSSYGLTQPLILPRQFMKNIGRDITVVKTDGTKIQGTLLSSNNEGIRINPKNTKKKQKTENIETAELEILFAETKEIKLIIKFK